MTITYNIEDQDVVVYTDGLCFVNASDKKLPGIKTPDYVGYVSSGSLSNTEALKRKPAMFNLTEGWWWLPPSYRMSVYTANEIFSNSFLDITRRITVNKNTFVYLEEEIRLDAYSVGMSEEIYYDITFHDEESLIESLREDISIADSGNISHWKNKLQIIDILYA